MRGRLLLLLVGGLSVAANAQDAPPTLTQTAYSKASNADAYDHFACGGSGATP